MEYCISEKIKITLIPKFLFYLLIVMSIFDQVREALPLSSLFMNIYAYLRDSLILYLTFFFRIKNKTKIINSVTVLLTILILFFSFLNSWMNGLGIGFAIKNIWLYSKHYLLYYIIFNYFFFSGYEKVFKINLKLAIIMSIASIIIVLFFSYLLTRLLSNGLRLTIGNSSTLSFFYLMLLIINLNNDFFKKSKTKYLISLILVFCICSTVTTTAFICLLPVFFIHFFSTNYKRRNGFIISFFIILLLSICLIIIFNDADFIEYFFSKIQEVIDVLFKSDKKQVGTLSIRENQKQIVFNSMSLFQYFVGLGIRGYCLYYSNLENFYYVIIANFGILIFVIYIIFMCKEIVLALYNKKYFKLELLVTFLLFSYTLDLFLPYITGYAFALSMAILRYKEREVLCH